MAVSVWGTGKLRMVLHREFDASMEVGNGSYTRFTVCLYCLRHLDINYIL